MTARRVELVLYHSRNCEACRAMKPEVVAFARAYPGIAVRYIDIDDAAAMATRPRRVSVWPDLVVLVDGREVTSRQGQRMLLDIERLVADVVDVCGGQRGVCRYPKRKRLTPTR